MPRQSTKSVDIAESYYYNGGMITPEQSRAARAWLEWSQEDLAARAGVAPSTIRDFEKGRRVPIPNNLNAIEAAFGTARIALLSDDGEPVGVRYVGRIKERDTYQPIIKLLDTAKDGFMSTSDLGRALEIMLDPKGEDAEILAGRSDTRFSQIVRNVISHRATVGNPIEAGWVEYDNVRRGLLITQAGRMRLVEIQGQQKNGP